MENSTSTTVTTTASPYFTPALNSAICSPLAGATAADCNRCYAAGCILCEVGPEKSYWALRGTGQEETPPGQHDFACIMSSLTCVTLTYTRPNTHYTSQVAIDQCDQVFSTTTLPQGTTAEPKPTRQPPPSQEAMWSGDPSKWGAGPWIVLSLPLALICFAISFFCCWLRGRRARQLQRVSVAPRQDSAWKDGETKMQWDMAQAGRISSQELQKVWKALKDAEKADGGPPRSRHLAFGACNEMGEEHLRMLGAILDHHPQVDISLDTDWRSSDDEAIKVLTKLLRRRGRCTLCSPDLSEGLSTLRLPPNSSPTTVEALVETLTSCAHHEVDAIAFAPPGPWPPPYFVKSSPVVALTALRQSSQELVLRRCAMADLGTIAVCAFIRPFAGRIQIMRLTECEIADEGVVALSRIMGSSLRELCLTSNCVGDRGIADIASVLGKCDSLERLLLDRNNIGNAGAKALGVHLPRSNVQELTLGSHLGGNPVGEDGVEALAQALDDELSRAAANRSSRLSALNLDGCIVGQRGAQALAASLPKSVIMALSVARGRIGDHGAEAIIQALPRSCLSLDLSSNGLTDYTATIVAEAFYRIPQLAVSLANNHLSVGLRAILHEEHGTRLRL